MLSRTGQRKAMSPLAWAVIDRVETRRRVEHGATQQSHTSAGAVSPCPVLRGGSRPLAPLPQKPSGTSRDRIVPSARYTDRLISWETNRTLPSTSAKWPPPAWRLKKE